jgi:hypothetical protein
VTVTRLTGGLTPGDGADPRTFPAIWNDTADTIDALRTGYVFVETVYFTSSGTFTKATYPWLRAIRVKVVGGGGGGGGAGVTGASQTAAGAGGGGGAYAESFITDITSLGASETITVGAGGTGGSSADGSNGGTSSFGSLVIAANGSGGSRIGATNVSIGNVFRPGGLGGNPSSCTGDLKLGGTAGGAAITGTLASQQHAGNGGGSILGGGAQGLATNGSQDGQTGYDFGGGGSGGGNIQNGATARDGGNGGPGVVIVELYA